MPSMSPRLKSIVSFAVRLVLSAGMFWLVARGTNVQQVANHVVTINPAVFVLAVAIQFAQTLVMNARWLLIMEAVGTPMRALAGLRILLVSLWFNQTLPSTVGGDLVRIWMLRAEGVDWRSAVKGVLADRVTALVGLVLLIAVGFPFLLMRISDPRAILAIGSLALAGIAGTAVLITIDKWPRRIRSIWPISKFASLGSLIRFLLLGFRRRGVLLSTAVLIHLMNTLICYVLAEGLHANLAIGDALLLIPPVILLSAIPISISGWGVRESAMVAGLTLVGVSPVTALATSVLVGLSSVVIGLIGGAVWLTSRDRQRFAAEQQSVTEHEAGGAARSPSGETA
jgi:uncharacterized membrane protein YbhN (UPF0104 family)